MKEKMRNSGSSRELMKRVAADRRAQLTVGFEEFVDVSKELQQPVDVVLRGAALQHREEQHRGLALNPLQREATRGRRTTVSQLHKERGRLETLCLKSCWVGLLSLNDPSVQSNNHQHLLEQQQV